MYNQSLKENKRCPINPLALAHYFGLNEPEKDELDADDEAKELSTSYRNMKEKSDALRKIILSVRWRIEYAQGNCKFHAYEEETV